jgi:hypothetical protein
MVIVAPAAILYVAPFGGDSAPYASWSDAATNLQDAVNAATAGDTVLVTNGVYSTGGGIKFGFMHRLLLTNEILICSVNGSSNTVIAGAPDPAGGALGADGVRPVYLSAGRLRGFTLRNGYTHSAGTLGQTAGGGVLMTGGTVSQCRVTGNYSAGNGGGGWLGDGACTSVTFVYNHPAATASGTEIRQNMQLARCRVDNLSRTFGDLEVLGTNNTVITNGTVRALAANGTVFGRMLASGGTITNTYTLTNAGVSELTIYKVTTNAGCGSDFTVMDDPSGTLATGATTSLSVCFDPQDIGIRAVELFIACNDPDDDPYALRLYGEGIEPDICILGTNLTLITNDSVAVSITNGTDFGEVRMSNATNDHIFTITNCGSSTLNITGVTTNGTGAPHFTVISAPAASVTTGAVTTFTLQFDPNAVGLHTAEVHVASDDVDTPDYTFLVAGTGVEPDIAVLGMDLSLITNGQTAVSISDGTDFGISIPFTGGVTRTFTITNPGTMTLALTNTPVVELTGSQTQDFSVIMQPAASISAGDTATFAVKYTPTQMGIQTATVSIANNDADENPYTFDICGTGPSNQFYDTGAGLTGVRGHALDWGDYDNDGDLDLAIAGYNGSARITKIYRNNGDNSFTDILAGLPGVENAALAWGDYDNDGDLDLAVAGYTGSPPMTVVFRNQGGGSFVDSGNTFTGIYNGSLAWGDYNNDGDLDLAVSGYTMTENVTLIYENKGVSGFTNIQAGLPGLSDSSLAWGDYDNDGDLDLAVAGQGSGIKIARVYENSGTGTFANSAASLRGISHGRIAWGDYNNDGYPDLAISGYSTNGADTRIYRNRGDKRFANNSSALQGLWLSSLAWGDRNNDGYLDLVVSGTGTNGPQTLLYQNDGTGAFTNAPINVQDLENGSVAWGDYDNDGVLDLAVAGITSTVYSARIYKSYYEITNTPPGMPTNLTTALTNNGDMILSWDCATDTQTPSNGLSYNLYLGTVPYSGNEVGAQADTTSGWRRIVACGNARQSLSRRISGLTGGVTLYWGVQAIDGAYAGSAFATGTFVRPLLPDFTVSGITLSREVIVNDEPAYADPPPTGDQDGREGRDDREGRETRPVHGNMFGDPVYADSQFTAYVTVTNSGGASGDGGLLAVWPDMTNRVSCGETGVMTMAVGTLAVGQSTQLVFSGLPVSSNAGTKTFRAYVDCECDAIETNKYNNQVTHEYTVLAPTNFAFLAHVRTNSIALHWSIPYFSGVSNNTVMIRYSTLGFPSGTSDGNLLYSGTNISFAHTNLTPDQTYYYRIWLSEDGSTFIDPPNGTNLLSAYPHLMPMSLLIRDSNTFSSGGKEKTRCRVLLFNGDGSGQINTNMLPNTWNLATKWSMGGAGNFNTTMPGDEVLLYDSYGDFLLIYFNYDGGLAWNNDTGSVYWTSVTLGRNWDTNAGAWTVDAVGDVNGDGQDELIVRSTQTYPSGGKTKADTRVLFFTDNGTGKLRNSQPDAFSFATVWTIAGMGNFNTHAVNSSSNSEQLLITQNANGAFYLLYFTDDGNLDWDHDDTNSIYWTSWDGGSSYATNDPTAWSVQAIGDVNGDHQDEVVIRNSESYTQGGKTKSEARVLFYADDGSGKLRDTQPDPFGFSTKWVIQGLGNFNSTNVNASRESDQLLLRQSDNAALYLLYFNNDGSLAWDYDDTNTIYWTSVTYGTNYCTNATSWSIQAVGDFRAGRE